MPDTAALLGLAKGLASLWHVLAFAAGFVFVIYSFQSLFGFRQYDPAWSRRIARADWHLILSGAAIIAIGMALLGPEKYLSNPKLWTKVVVVIVWLASTAVMRRHAASWIASGRMLAMSSIAAVSLSCWIYGTFLGTARELAFGVVPFAVLLSGFFALTMVCIVLGISLDERRRYSASENS
jgi:hypothetical protein